MKELICVLSTMAYRLSFEPLNTEWLYSGFAMMEALALEVQTALVVECGWDELLAMELLESLG